VNRWKPSPCGWRPRTSSCSVDERGFIKSIGLTFAASCRNDDEAIWFAHWKYKTQEQFMKIAMTLMVAGALITGTTLANAGGVSANTPGHKMQAKGSVKGSPGASGYAPGHRMQAKGSVKGTTGASGYAPGHSTTTGSGSTR